MKKVKKTVLIDEDIFKQIMKEVKQDCNSSFNREINYVLTEYFQNGGRGEKGLELQMNRS